MNLSGLIPIHPLTLVPNYCAGTNIYLWNEKTQATVKFLSSEQIVSQSSFSFLIANPEQKVYVEDTSYQSYQDYLIENLEAWLVETRVPRMLKTAVVTEYFHTQYSKAYQQKTVSAMLASGNDCCQKLGNLGHHIEINGRELQRILRHDDSFVTHAVNTAFYTYLIAECRGYCAEMIIDVCVGAMIHDIGKIEPSFLDDNSELMSGTDHDWSEESRNAHPTEGFRRLCNEPGITTTQLLMTYQHHERPDGKGFPVGLWNDEVHEASKICAVANRFDGLTSNRPHRPGMTRLASLRVMEPEKNTALDSEMIRCLEEKLNQVSTN